MRCKELRSDALSRGLLSDRLCPVLAEFRDFAFVGVRPGTSWTIKSVLLVDSGQSEQGPARTHLFLRVSQGTHDTWNSRGPLLGIVNRQRLLGSTVGLRLIDHLPDSFEDWTRSSILADGWVVVKRELVETVLRLSDG